MQCKVISELSIEYTKHSNTIETPYVGSCANYDVYMMSTSLKLDCFYASADSTIFGCANLSTISEIVDFRGAS